MKKILLTLFALVTFLTAPTLIQAALVTTPWRYNTTTQSIYPYPLSVQKVGIGTTTPGQTLSVGGDILGNNIIGSYFTATSTTATSTFSGNLTVGGSTVFANNNSIAVGNSSVTATGNGSAAFGYRETAIGPGTAKLTASGFGSLATGHVILLLGDSEITSSGGGSVAHGYASGNGKIISSGSGSFAGGYTTSGSITSSNNGSFAWGGTSLGATASLSTAFGTGFTNSTANTFMVGYSSTPTLTVNSTGLGIGTTSPRAKLDVAGTNNGTTPLFQVSSVASFATTTRFIIDSGGNVGIGTAAPTTGVHVLNRSMAVENGTLIVANAGQSYFSYLGVNILGINDAGLYTSGDSAIAVNVGNNYYYGAGLLRVRSDTGRLGIGSTTPGTILSIGDTGANTINISATATSTFGSGLNIRTGCFAINGTCLSTGGSSGSSYPFNLTGNATSTLTQFNGGLTAYASTTIGDGTSIGGLTISGNSTTTGTAYFAGSVGIGTTSPWGKLSVANSSLSALPAFVVSTSTASATSTAFIVGANGNVGIGSTTPNYALSISNTMFYNATSQFLRVGDSGGSTYLGKYPGGFGLGGLWHGGSTPTGANYSFITDGLDSYFNAPRIIYFRINNNTSGLGMAIASNSNVGIATTSPLGRLSVEMDTTNPSFIISNQGSSTPAFVVGGVNQNGNVGIGTTSPGQKLSVAGDILGNNIIGSNFTATSSTATNYFAGNVGLATTSPGARLGIQSNSPDGYFEVFRGNKTTLALPGEDLFAFTIKSIVTGKNAFRINNESPYSVLLGENGFGKVGVSTSSPWAVFSVDSALIDPLDKTLPAFVIASSTTSNLIVTYSGNVGVGTTSPWRKLSVTGTAAISGLTAFASGDSAVCQRAGGEITANSGVTSCIVSSKFVKDPQGDISYQKAFDRITRLQPVMFKYKDGGKEDLGLYAEDVAKVDARYAQYTTQEKEVNGHHFNVGDPSAINWAAINADMIVVLQHQTLSGRAMRTAENNWQWIALVILGLIVAKQQLDIKKLNRE